MSKFELVNLIISEGALEVLEYLKELETAHFNDLRNLKNTRTNKIFSANTLSIRLKELVAKGAISRVVSASPKGRNVVAYKITKHGKQTLEIAYKFEDELNSILK